MFWVAEKLTLAQRTRKLFENGATGVWALVEMTPGHLWNLDMANVMSVTEHMCVARAWCSYPTRDAAHIVDAGKSHNT